MSNVMEKYKIGLDLSYHNRIKDFKAIKESGVEFVILRQGYRTTEDLKFAEYLNGFRSVEIPVPAIYHFLYPLSREDAVAEARFTVDQAVQYGLEKESTIIFSDFEYDTVKKAGEKGITLGPEQCREYTKAFCDTVESLGWKSGVYTNKDYYKNWYGENFLKDRIVWLADYSGEADYPCDIQQYTSTGTVNGIAGNVDRNWLINPLIFKMGEGREPVLISHSREEVAKQALCWIGKNEKDGSHKEIIDVYNTLAKPLPRSTKMQYDWPWCACFWSAVALKLGYQEIMPIEISCNELVKKAQDMGIWVEDDSYIPSVGDGILYDWQDNGVGDNTGWPDHIGIVTEVGEKSFQVVEGNYNDKVDTRTVSVGALYIRGYITPKYDDLNISKEEENQVSTITGQMLFLSTIAGEYVTTGDLYCRPEPGTDNNPLFVLKKGTRVSVEGRCGIVGLILWPKISYEGKEGYCSGKYLERV